jgi:hypothetical protein
MILYSLLQGMIVRSFFIGVAGTLLALSSLCSFSVHAANDFEIVPESKKTSDQIGEDVDTVAGV